MRRKALLLPLGIFLVFVLFSVALLTSCGIPTPSPLGDRVGLLYIEGLIMSGKQSDLGLISGGAMSDHIVEVIHQAIEDRGIKALVLRINSPGGSSPASQEIFQAIRRFAETGRPVIASMGDVAASGGYYVACAADEIYANPSTLTGSIGVAMPLSGYEGLFKLLGIEDRSLHAGEYKDIGSPTRPMREDEKKILQAMIDQVYDQFWRDVASRRGFNDDQRGEIAEGLIFTGEQAKEKGLVDELGGLRDAIARAGELSGLGDKPVVDTLGEIGLLEQLLGKMGSVSLFSGEGVKRALGQMIDPTKAAQNPFYRLWGLLLVEPLLLGDQAGMKF